MARMYLHLHPIDYDRAIKEMGIGWTEANCKKIEFTDYPRGLDFGWDDKKFPKGCEQPYTVDDSD